MATRAAAEASVDVPVDDGSVAVKLELLKKVACLNRGAIATSNDKYEIGSFIESLEEIARDRAASGSGQPINIFDVQGKWELLYSSVEQFRSSPFFWAFQEGLVQNRDIASEIFKFTDSIPGAHVGTAYQTISFDTGSLISEVDLYVFPGLRGTVVTTSTVEPDLPNKLNVTVENTRVVNSNLVPFIDNITVPVKDIFEQIRGPGATNALVEVRKNNACIMAWADWEASPHAASMGSCLPTFHTNSRMD